MKHLLAIVFCGIYFISIGQTYSFYPKWEKGDSKTIYITHNEVEFENEILLSDTTYTSGGEISVISEDKDFVTIKVLYENIALTSVKAFYDKFDEELKDYKTLKLIYKIDKKTGAYSLTNWKNAQSFMNDSFDQITNLMTEKVPEMEAFAQLIFTPLKDIFKSKENIEGYYKDQIGYLFVPFGNKFEEGESISVTESSENPFNPEQEISQTTTIRLKSVAKSDGKAIFEKEIDLDLEEFVDMMKGMMVSMTKSLGVDDELAEEKSKEFDDFDMQMDNLQTIYFDLKTNWVTKAISTAEVIVLAPETNKKSIVTTTYLIK